MEGLSQVPKPINHFNLRAPMPDVWSVIRLQFILTHFQAPEQS